LAGTGCCDRLSIVNHGVTIGGGKPRSSAGTGIRHKNTICKSSSKPFMPFEDRAE
jgi:hypothetical protein